MVTYEIYHGENSEHCTSRKLQYLALRAADDVANNSHLSPDL